MDNNIVRRSGGPTIDIRSSSSQMQSRLAFDTGANHRYGNIQASGNTRAFLGNVHGNVQGDIYGNVINNYQTESKEDAASIREGCLSALLLSDPQESKEALKDRKGDRAEGTCTWFLESDEFKRWSDGEERDTDVLWLHGHPGTGKSTMSIFVVDSLVQKFQGRADVIFCYFFCDTNSEEQNSAVAILRGFLYQLCTIEIALGDGARADTYFLDKYIVPEYRVKGNQLFAKFSSLSRIFQAILRDKHGGRKLFLLDALDECDSESQRLFLRHLNRATGHFKEARLLITSRPHANIQEYLQGFPNRDLASFEAARHDVDVFIAGKISELTIRKRYTAKLRSQLLQTLTTKAEGTFLWVGLACKELDEVDAKDCLQLLSRLPSGLDHLYADLLDRALEKAGPEANNLIQLLKFVSVALSPITLGELSVACRLYEQEEADERELFTRNMVEACRLMVVFIDNKYVRLLHKSVRDFLFGSATEHFPSIYQADAEIASRCVDRLIENHETHIKFRDTGGFPDTTFVKYAASHWPDHVHLAAGHYKIMPHQRPFFSFDSAYRERWLTEALLDGWTVEGAISIFHVVAEWGLWSLLEYIKAQTYWHVPSLRLEDCRRKFQRFGGNPLVAAAASNHVDILEALLDIVMIEIDNHVTISSSEGDLPSPRQEYRFPITPDVVMAAAENYETGPAMMRLLLSRNKTLPIDEDFIEFVIENAHLSKEILMILLNEIDEEIMLFSAAMEIDSTSNLDGNEVRRDNRKRSKPDTTLRPSMVESIVRHFDRSVFDPILDTIDDRDAVTLGKLLEAAAHNIIHGPELMKAILAHSKVDLMLSHALIEKSTKRFDGNLVRQLIHMAGIEIDKSLLISATYNQQFGPEVVSAILEFNPQISVDVCVLETAMENKKFGKELVAQLLNDTKVALRPSIGLLQSALQKDVFNLQFLDHLEDISMVLPALHGWLEDASSSAKNSYNDAYIDDSVRERGRELLEMLLEQQKHSFVITAEVLRVARKIAFPQESFKEICKRKSTLISHSPELAAEAASWLGQSAMQALCGNNENTSYGENPEALGATRDRNDNDIYMQDPQESSSENDIILAIQHNDDDALETLLLEMAPIIGYNQYTDFVLTAVKHDSIRALKTLLKMQREVGCVIKEDGESLYQAVMRSQIGAIKVLLADGVNVNARNNCNTPILCAAALAVSRATNDISGRTNPSDLISEEIMRLLLEAGADPNARNGRASTALQIAVWSGNSKIVGMLIAAGADVNAQKGRFGSVLADAAFSTRDSTEVFRLLIEHGARFDVATNGLHVLRVAIQKHNDRIIHLLLDQWSWPQQELQNLLLMSCVDLKRSTVLLLLRHGVEIDAVDDEGQTCLHRVVTQCMGLKSDFWFLELFIDAGARINESAHDGQTALHWACRYRAAESIVIYLLDHGARTEEVDRSGCTPLHTALYVGNLDTALILQKRGARTDIVDCYGITAMQLLVNYASLSPFINVDGKTGDPNQLAKAMVHLLQNMRSIKIIKKVDPFFPTSRSWSALARWLLRIRQPDEAVTALEQVLERGLLEPSHLNVLCDRCDDGLWGIRHKCGICDDCDLCDRCWTEQDDITTPPCCANHKAYFIHVPSSSWKDRPAGIVNDRNESMEAWFARLEDACCKELKELDYEKMPTERGTQRETETEQQTEISHTLFTNFQDTSMCDQPSKSARISWALS